jgi:hypothetical protein
MLALALALALSVSSALACGGSAPSSQSARVTSTSTKNADATASPSGSSPTSAPATSSAPVPAAPEAQGMPSRCADGGAGAVCLPPAYLARALCHEDYPTVALAMFARGTPWTRAYSMTTSAAWNASGGASSNERMAMHEELLILRRRGADTSGIQVSGAGASYDALRWDGSCVTLQDGELTFQVPPKVASARVVLKRLELHVRDALKDVPELSKLYQAHRKECKGVTIGDVSKECEKLDGQLSIAVANYVRERGGVPEPHKLPKPR